MSEWGVGLGWGCLISVSISGHLHVKTLSIIDVDPIYHQSIQQQVAYIRPLFIHRGTGKITLRVLIMSKTTCLSYGGRGLHTYPYSGYLDAMVSARLLTIPAGGVGGI